MSRYRFLSRPGWIIFSVVVVLLVILMLNLSAWQFRRLHERRSFNAEVRSRTSAAAAPFDTVIPPGTTVDGARPEEWKTVTVTGTFDPSAQVLIRNRSLDAAPGYHVVTPLKRADGSAVLVVRGWVPLSTSNSTTPDVPEPVTGTVTVEGRVRPTQNPGALASRDPAEGVLATLARIDIPRIQQQTAYPIAPAYVEMSSSSPAPTTALPALVPLPELDDGPHLGYAVQWIIFSICAVIGWFLIVRKTVKANDQKAALAAREQAAVDAARADPSAVDEPGGTDDPGVVQQLGDDDRRADLDVR
jgi:cytochrome oxidase assembly protein ShyY1